MYLNALEQGRGGYEAEKVPGSDGVHAEIRVGQQEGAGWPGQRDSWQGAVTLSLYIYHKFSYILYIRSSQDAARGPKVARGRVIGGSTTAVVKLIIFV